MHLNPFRLNLEAIDRRGGQVSHHELAFRLLPPWIMQVAKALLDLVKKYSVATWGLKLS